MRLRRACAIAGVIGAALPAAVAAEGATPVLSSHGIAGARFGTSKSQAVERLTAVLGSPSARFVSNGCGPNYTEVEWGHLYAEFRRGKLTGFRYVRGAWSGGAPAPAASRRVSPRLVTSKGVSLSSTLGQVRRRYGKLGIVGTDRWRSRDGLIFYVSYETTQPAPPTSRIIEIKYGTCGDW
ncbi:MAG TPA: hypothetical protein VFA97_00125 [Gaiellaceae bacterium]|nr:hypothetical protein [Gaiellaceae bacterium]